MFKQNILQVSWPQKRLFIRMHEQSSFQNKSQILVHLFPTKEKSTIQTLVAFLNIPALLIAASQNYHAALKHGKWWISFSLYMQ